MKLLSASSSTLLHSVCSAYDGIVATVWNENATASELCVVVVALSVFWAAVFAAFAAAARPLVHGKPWLRQLAEREYERGGKKQQKKIGFDMTKEEFVDATMNLWPLQQAVLLQHLAGGLLCVPSVFSISSVSETSATSLACLGILSEMGWEVADLFVIFSTRFGSKQRKVLLPNKVSLFRRILNHSLLLRCRCSNYSGDYRTHSVSADLFLSC